LAALWPCGIMPPGGVSGKWRATRISEVRTHFRSRFAIDCCTAQAFQNEPVVPSGLRAGKNQPVEKPVDSSAVVAPVGGMELEGWTLPADKRFELVSPLPLQCFVVNGVFY
jgi:hypothetical protein